MVDQTDLFEKPIEIGSIVKVKGIPGPSMRVLDIHEDNMIELLWFSATNELETVILASECLGVM